MIRTLRWPLLALVAWSVFVWGNRISNTWRSTTETTGAKVTSTALALSFLLFAAAVLVIAIRAWRRPLDRIEAGVVVAFAGWTVAVWIVRMVGIVLADHVVGFKVVHTMLGVVSIVLAALATWVARAEAFERQGRGSDAGTVSPVPDPGR